MDVDSRTDGTPDIPIRRMDNPGAVFQHQQLLLVEKMGADKFVSKIFLTVAFIIINYFMSKIFVFRNEHGVKSDL